MQVAALWTGNQVTLLADPAGPRSVIAYGTHPMNNNGDVLGTLCDGTEQRKVLWRNGKTIPITTSLTSFQVQDMLSYEMPDICRSGTLPPRRKATYVTHRGGVDRGAPRVGAIPRHIQLLVTLEE